MTATDTMVSIHPILMNLIIATVGGIGIYLINFTGGRRSFNLYQVVGICVVSAVGLMIVGDFNLPVVAINNTDDTDDVNNTVSSYPPDLSSLENEICDYDFQIRSAPKIYSDAAVLEQKLHELMTKQIALIDEYNTRVDNWNGNVDSLVVLNMTAGAKMIHFSGCD